MNKYPNHILALAYFLTVLVHTLLLHPVHVMTRNVIDSFLGFLGLYIFPVAVAVFFMDIVAKNDPKKELSFGLWSYFIVAGYLFYTNYYYSL